MQTVVVIPARLSSTRLDKKVIRDLCGKPMIEHVYRAAQKADGIDAVFIATDSSMVKEICATFTSNVIMTSHSHESGTDRIAEAVENIACKYVINVQGDEPLIDPELISLLAKKLYKDDMDMISAMHRIKTMEQLRSPHNVKVIVDKNSNALYFSRAIIPYNREEKSISLTQCNFYKHIGIYGYKKDFLKHYSKMLQSDLEYMEKLEQLRVLENGYSIHMIETEYEPTGVDTYEDLERVRGLMGCL